jgi:hypothetical protein
MACWKCILADPHSFSGIIVNLTGMIRFHFPSIFTLLSAVDVAYEQAVIILDIAQRW